MSDSKQSKHMGLFARFLTLWVLLSIIVGIALGNLTPGLFHRLGGMDIAHINMPVALLIWAMILPMLLKIDYSALHEVWDHRRGVGVTLAINWLVKPFSMAVLAYIFLRVLFADWLDAGQIDSYIAGLILLAAAPCTAMVFVWSKLVEVGRWSSAIHAVASGAERCDYDFRLCTGCGAVAGRSFDHRALGYAVSVGVIIYRYPCYGGLRITESASGARQAG